MLARLSVIPVLFLGMIVLFSADSMGQQKKGKGGGNFKMPDPKETFDKLSKGRGFFLVSEADPRQQQRLAPLAGPDGKITQAKYMEYSEQRAKMFADMQSKGFDFSKFKKSDPAKGGIFPGSTAPKPGAVPEKPASPPSADELRKIAEAEFAKRDINGDGVLNADEMHPTLRRELPHWDKNQDGVIDLKEFVAYYSEHSLQERQQRQEKAEASAASADRIVIDLDELDRRPVVYRANNLPKEIPAWFTEIDTNGDGIVSLYEWRKAGREIPDFQKLDRNDDGLITPDEVLRDMGIAMDGRGPTTTVTQIAGASGKGSPGADFMSRFANRGNRVGPGGGATQGTSNFGKGGKGKGGKGGKGKKGGWGGQPQEE